MKFFISNEVRAQRQKVIEDLLRDGMSLNNGSPSLIAAAARTLNCDPKTLRDWLEREASAFNLGIESYLPNWDIKPDITETEISLPDIPPSDLPVDEILEFLTKRNKARLENAKAKEWRPIHIHSDKPIVLAFIGDPHLDSPECNLELLLEHIEILKKPEVLSICVGDVHNNWAGRMEALYSEQETSKSTAYKLIRWFMFEAKINWLFWISGNHDSWNHGYELLKSMANDRLLIEDWEAKVTLKFDSGLDIPIWVAHDFKGKSQFNQLHGLVKASRENRKAKILASGHTHTWGVAMEEDPHTNETIHFLRARGYKFYDNYALVNGFPEYHHGSTVAVVIDPREKDISRAITSFSDLDKAHRFCKTIT